jgi:hypothetical protein
MALHTATGASILASHTEIPFVEPAGSSRSRSSSRSRTPSAAAVEAVAQAAAEAELAAATAAAAKKPATKVKQETKAALGDASSDDDDNAPSAAAERRLLKSMKSMFEAFAGNVGNEFKSVRAAQEAADKRFALFSMPAAASTTARLAAAADVLSRPGALGLSPAAATAVTQLSSATVSSPPLLLPAPTQQSGIGSLPDRLRAADFRSTSGTDLLHAFLTDAARNPHHKQKPFKSRDEFYEHIMPTIRSTATAAQLDNHRQLIDMVTLMSKIESQLGWTAADAYWWRVQSEVRLGTHVFLSPSGAAMCPGVFTSLYHEHAGRHRSGASSTSSAPAKHAKPKAGTAGGCIHHPHSTTHTTAECRAAASSSSSTSTEGKHA